jgi:hypothetical protein
LDDEGWAVLKFILLITDKTPGSTKVPKAKSCGWHCALRPVVPAPLWKWTDGSEPTGRTVSFKGASIIQVEGDKIRSDQCYFDRKALDKQLEPCS